LTKDHSGDSAPDTSPKRPELNTEQALFEWLDQVAILQSKTDQAERHAGDECQESHCHTIVKNPGGA